MDGTRGLHWMKWSRLCMEVWVFMTFKASTLLCLENKDEKLFQPLMLFYHISSKLNISLKRIF